MQCQQLPLLYHAMLPECLPFRATSLDFLKSGYPLHRENRENDKKKFCQGKTQGIWFAQVVNSLILKVKDISILVVNISKFLLKLAQVCQVSFVYVIVRNDLYWHRENMWLNRENTGNSKMQSEWVPC